MPIQWRRFQQFGVRSDGFGFPVVQQNDLIAKTERRQPGGQEQHGATGADAVVCIFQHRFRVAVEGIFRFGNYHQRRIAQHRPRQAEPEALSGIELFAMLAEHGFVPLRQLEYKVVRVCLFRCVGHLLQ